jgi:hypothetical protein
MLVGDANSRRALVQGFIDVVAALSADACNTAVKKWAKGLDRTIARFVTRKTEEYADNCRTLYQAYSECSLQALGAADGYNAFKFVDRTGIEHFFFGESVRSTRSDWNRRVKNDQSEWTLPFFACEHPDHAWRDDLNCDVPSFYHFLGDRELRNTKGDAVDVSAAVAWQNKNIANPGDLEEFCGRPRVDGSGFEKTAEINQYFPMTAIDMVTTQLDQLKTKCATRQGMRDFVASALAGVKGGNLAGLIRMFV